MCVYLNLPSICVGCDIGTGLVDQEFAPLGVEGVRGADGGSPPSGQKGFTPLRAEGVHRGGRKGPPGGAEGVRPLTPPFS